MILCFSHAICYCLDLCFSDSSLFDVTWYDIQPSMVTHTLNSCSAINPSKVHTHPEKWAAIYDAVPGEHLGVRLPCSRAPQSWYWGWRRALDIPTIPAGPRLIRPRLPFLSVEHKLLISKLMAVFGTAYSWIMSYIYYIKSYRKVGFPHLTASLFQSPTGFSTKPFFMFCLHQITWIPCS